MCFDFPVSRSISCFFRFFDFSLLWFMMSKSLIVVVYDSMASIAAIADENVGRHVVVDKQRKGDRKEK